MKVRSWNWYAVVLLVLVIGFLAYGGYEAMSTTLHNPPPASSDCQPPFGQPVC